MHLRHTVLDATLGSAWINLGTALAQTGKRAEAREAFERALQLDPQDPRARDNLRELEQTTGPAKR
jgi:Flp pilus assembly protein TadD